MGLWEPFFEVIFLEKKAKWKGIVLKSLSYLFVALLASALTMAVMLLTSNTKLTILKGILEQCYIGDADSQKLEDAAANAMVDALGDRWSYYIPASEYQAHQESKTNTYVGIGVTVQARAEKDGIDVIRVEPGGSAQEAGILPGDILIGVDGTSLIGKDVNESKALITGNEGTKVTVTILRGTEEKTFELTRKRLSVEVAKGQLLENNIGLVRIENFNSNCAKETLEQVNALLAQGAQALIFDVRYNPGGYVNELVPLLDALLPEGVLFRSLSYTGAESVDRSDANCIDVPMAVLINGDSYSAAEFFAAALEEYDWALVVGEPTCGKGYFQNTIPLPDGSAVNLSIGKYFTPKGVCLADVGGLKPQGEYLVEVDRETAALIYSGLLGPKDDPQIQTAVNALLQEIGN